MLLRVVTLIHRMAARVVMLPRPAFHRMKHPLDRGKTRPFAPEQLSHRRIVWHPNDDAIAPFPASHRHLDREMQIADRPAQARRFCGIAQRNFQNGLRPLLDHVTRRFRRKENRAIREWLLQIKAKLPSIRRHPAPAPFRDLIAPRTQGNRSEPGFRQR